MVHVHLDPGHYGSAYNHGLNGYIESNFTWDFTNILKTELEARGCLVTLSRTTKDANPGLVERGSTKADIFISIHSNAASRESADHPVIYRTMSTNAKGIELAKNLVNMIHTVMGTTEAGDVRTKANDNGEDYYGVLRGAARVGTPIAFIIEHSFHTNNKASLWLLNKANYTMMAKQEAEIIAKSLGSQPVNTTLNPMDYTNEQFAEKIAKAVQAIAPKYGIKVYSPVIAQAILESGWGRSNKAKYYNFFGLKYREGRLNCHTGTFVDGSAEQLPDGTYVPITDQWFAFDSIEHGVEGYFQYTNIARYANLKGVEDPHQYLVNIKADGYATSLEYVEKVYAVITRNNLTKYDAKNLTVQQKIYFQAGAYKNRNYAQSMLTKLGGLGIPSCIYVEGSYFKVGITAVGYEDVLKANKISYFKKEALVTTV